MREKPIEEAAAVRALCAVHAVLLWLGVTFIPVLMIFCRERVSRTALVTSSVSCLLALCCAALVGIVESGGHIPTPGGAFHRANRVGCLLWFFLLCVRCIRPTAAMERFVRVLSALLALVEWASVTVRVLTSDGYRPDVTVDLFFAVLETGVLVALVGWGHLMISDIAVIFPAATAAQDGGAASIAEGETDMMHGAEANFGPDDMLELSQQLCTGTSTSFMHRSGSRRCVLRVMVHRWGGTYAALAVVRFVYEFGGLVPAHLLRVLMDNLAAVKKDHDRKREDDGLQMAIIVTALIVACNLVCTFLRAHYRVRLQQIVLYNQGLLTAELFRCTLCRRKCLFEGKTQGDVMNHLSLDVVRVANAASSFNDLWALPLQLSLALYLLYIQVSFAFISGVVVSVALIPVNMWLTKRIQVVASGLMKENDERVLRITEIVRNIIYVKMCGWSHLVQQWVKESRERYMVHLKWLKYLDAFCVFFWATTPTIVSLMTFITFVLMGGELTPGKAVTALALFNSLTMPLNAYPCVINGLVESYVSWCRLSPFLVMPADMQRAVPHDVARNGSPSGVNQFCGAVPEACSTATGGEVPSVASPSEIQPLLQVQCGDGGAYRQHVMESCGLSSHSFRRHHNLLVDIRNGVICFHQQDSAGCPRASFALRIPTFQVASGQLIAIVGASGSGKSTFLDGLAGERVIYSNDTMARICVSRLSIAYVEQQPFLTSGTLRENILTGLPHDPARYDAVVKASALVRDFHTCFHHDGDAALVGDRGIRLSGGQRARVALARALYAGKELYLIDDVLGCLDPTVAHHIVTHALVGTAKRGGCVVVATHNEELIRRADAVYTCADGQLLLTARPGETSTTMGTSGCLATPVPHAVEHQEVLDCDGQGWRGTNATSHDDRRTRTCDSSSRVPITTSESGTPEATEVLETSKRGAIAWGTLTCYVSRVGWKLSAFIVMSVAAMQLSRNAGDQYIVAWARSDDGDTSLFMRALGTLAAVNSVLALTFLLFGAAVVIIINSSSLLVLVFIPLTALYYRIQYPYRAASRELRRLEEAASAPLLDTMRDALDGGVMMRSLGNRMVVAHLCRANRNVDRLLQAKFNSMLLSAWFGIRLELIGLLPLVFVGGTAIYYHGYSFASFTGLALAYVQPLTSYVGGLLGAFASTETELISVERMRQYFSLPAEERGPSGMCIPPPRSHWPSRGEVVFNNVSMRYDPSGPQVLRSLSFSVFPGEKVAVVGRTGAGKSSIFAALLRLVEIESGSIHIDGYDIRRLPLDVLRTRLSVLPQQPFIFSGSWRRNIDPFGLHSDDAVRAAAACVKLDNVALDCTITDSGRISGGQRHQIALARVILQRSPLLLLDEPTSQSSTEGEAALWHSLAAYMKSTTVLCITHKLSHIDIFDRVVVVENGCVTNSGTVARLRGARVWPFSSCGDDVIPE